MAGIAAAGRVSGAGRAAARVARTSRFAFSLATAADDAELRALLAAHPFDGDIQVTLEREPSFAAASALDGDVSDTIVARDRLTGRIVAMGTRSERDVYINGENGRVGYLGQLRIAPEFRRHRDLLLHGFAECRALHDAGRVRLYLASVVADNARAARLLTSARLQQRPGWMPRFEEYARVETVLLPTRTPSPSPPRPPLPLPSDERRAPGRGIGGRRTAPLGSEAASSGSARQRQEPLEIVRGSEALRPAIDACLARNQRRFQFAWRWRVDAGRGPHVEDFFVAWRGERVVGCVARWDQRACKQVRVRGYAPALARWRWAINLVAPLIGAPRLPPAGALLAFAYLSHVAIDDDDPRVLCALVEAAREAESAEAIEYLVIGLAERHPLLMAFAGMRVRRYVSQLYLVSWEDGRAAIEALDGRLPHVEVATL